MIDPKLKVACILLPARQFQLLLPATAVAEILHNASFKPTQHAPSWLCGVTNWHNKSLLTVAPDALDSELTRPVEKKNIVAVFRNPHPQSKIQHLGIVVSRMPGLITASARNITNDPSPARLHRFAASYVRADGEPAFIPDLKALFDFVEQQPVHQF